MRIHDSKYPYRYTYRVAVHWAGMLPDAEKVPHDNSATSFWHFDDPPAADFWPCEDLEPVGYDEVKGAIDVRNGSDGDLIFHLFLIDLVATLVGGVITDDPDGKQFILIS